MYASSILTAAILNAAANAAPQILRRGEAESNTTANNIDLIHQLELAPTAVDRFSLLNDTDFIYDFLAPPPGDAVTTGKGGHTVKADRKLFPALIGTGVSMTLGFIGPCGFNTPHTHPRSSQINVVVEGSLATLFVPENGVEPIGPNVLDKFQMTVFPQGSTHMEWNPNCDPAVFAAGFASEDPGVEQSAQTLFELSAEVVQADLGVTTLNGESIAEFDAKLPANVALGVRSCLKKCGIPVETPNQNGSPSVSSSAGRYESASATMAYRASSSADPTVTTSIVSSAASAHSSGSW
jgi:hypothetical protein